jgi:glycerate dehydrogenase
MNICILDGYTLNPGDLDWSELAALGTLEYYDRTPTDKIVERAQQAEIILTNKTPLTKETLDSLPNLKYIGVLATGFDVVDTVAASEKGIVVTNIPTYGTDSVGQMVMALILEHCHHVQRHSDSVRAGEWGKNADWCFWNYPLVELSGKTIGIVGFGRIGQRTAEMALAFGMNILAYDQFQRDINLPNFKWVELTELLVKSDFISLHCPLTPETTHMINKENLQLLKPSAFIVNTSRGKLIHNGDLADALNEGRIAGAGLDVLDVEPPDDSNPLLSAKNCFVTPHISWGTKEARSRLLAMAISNIKAFKKGQPTNVVNLNISNSLT